MPITLEKVPNSLMVKASSHGMVKIKNSDKRYAMRLMVMDSLNSVLHVYWIILDGNMPVTAWKRFKI